jgi:hypothetical protein
VSSLRFLACLYAVILIAVVVLALSPVLLVLTRERADGLARAVVRETAGRRRKITA